MVRKEIWELHLAALKLGNFYRRIIYRRALASTHKNRLEASIKIQRMWRRVQVSGSPNNLNETPKEP